MSNFTKILVLVILVMGLSSFGSTVYAYNITYNPLSQPHFTRIPTVCAIEPDDPALSQNQLNFLMENAKDRVSEWANQLAQGNRPQNWDLKFQTYTSSQFQTLSSSTCDIVMAFQERPGPNDSLPPRSSWI